MPKLLQKILARVTRPCTIINKMAMSYALFICNYQGLLLTLVTCYLPKREQEEICEIEIYQHPVIFKKTCLQWSDVLGLQDQVRVGYGSVATVCMLYLNLYRLRWLGLYNTVSHTDTIILSLTAQYTLLYCIACWV